MCTDPAPSHPHPALTAPPPQEPGPDPADRIGLDPVDAIRLTTLVDNQTDLLLPDQGLALAHSPRPAWPIHPALLGGPP